MKNNQYALILAGGIGSRFWPVSRSTYPKQFLDILGTGKSLIQNTYDRFAQIVPKQNIFILTNESYFELVNKQIPGLHPNQIIGEPVMRNTAPCIAYGCYKIKQLCADAAIVVAPSDHLILDTPAFIHKIETSLDVAEQNDCLITLGIQPSRPDTGYGYIQYNQHQLSENLYKVKTFTEKPSLEIAESFLLSGDFLWNAGIFIWSVNSIIQAFNTHLPDIAEIFNEGNGLYNTPSEKEFIQTCFQKCTNISIDYGVMEKANNVYVMPSEFGWSDLGTWASIYELALKDNAGNAIINPENVVMIDSSNCMVNVPKDKLVILQDLHDFIVVEANNTLLISPKVKEQTVKQIVADVKTKYGNKYI
ncbi:MAG: mannose-1-phosphate guanylyltransferase [Sphingobacteriales bacterium]|nr:MAG: mannose-1-phosphate guanylyltransferase [Sphingobacteriales bacterium]TAF83880.1 MAG: mannose-1-phosphate guanylyltransferase [Sphingobacteriales bacterium]